MVQKSKKNCNGEVVDLFKFCYNPNVCFPRVVPIKNQQPSFFSGSGNNPQFLLTQAGKYSFLANPVTSSGKGSTILIKPPQSVAPILIENNLY